jgi:hypothetical protein
MGGIDQIGRWIKLSCNSAVGKSSWGAVPQVGPLNFRKWKLQRPKSQPKPAGAWPRIRFVKSDYYSVVLPAAFAFCHLALATADILARAAALIFLRPFVAGFRAPLLFNLPHLFRAPAAIAARPAADILRFTKGEGIPAPLPPMISSNWACRDSSFALILMALFSCLTVTFEKVLFIMAQR